MHPALGETHELFSDIYPPLFDKFFSSQEFVLWRSGKSKWRRLHCVGGPGSGKTTLSALAVQDLRRTFGSADTPVASIFIKADVRSNEAAFVEDFLASVSHQLGTPQTALDNVSFDTCEEYAEARAYGKRAAHRVHLIREALYSRLKSCDRAFLVLDDFDQCSPAIDVLLETELSNMQRRGLSVMVTSRLPVLETLGKITCDVPGVHDVHTSNYLTLFWECTACRNFIMCYPCKEKVKVCQKCGKVSSFDEPYEHVHFPTGLIHNESMREFVAWDLEKEHGDLGLGSSYSPKPPLSILGASLREDRTGGVAQGLLKDIVDRVHGNVAIAKLSLDLVHREQTLEAIKAVRDRLPSNFLALFDAGIKGIEEQPDAQRDLGLNAISAARESLDGVELDSLVRRLLRVMPRSDSGSTPSPSLKDVLRAAKGFLVHSHTEDVVAIYNTTFSSYVAEDYNESLFWAHAQLPSNGIARSFTLNNTLDPTFWDDESLDRHGNQVEEPAGTVRFANSARTDSSEESTTFNLSRTFTGSFLRNDRRSKQRSMLGRLRQ